jgi:hypothetical protein
LGLGLAIVTFVVMENPLRRSAWLKMFSWRTFALGGTLTAAALIVYTAAWAGVPSLVGHGTAPVAKITVASPTPAKGGGSDGTGSATSSSTGGGADSSAATTANAHEHDVNPYETELNEATAQAQAQAQVARSVGVNDVPTNLTPSLADAETDEPVVFTDGCLDSYLVPTLNSCDFGDTSSSSTSVVLFGDSHAGMWFPAVQNAANTFDWNLFLYTKTTCPPWPSPSSARCSDGSTPNARTGGSTSCSASRSCTRPW